MTTPIWLLEAGARPDHHAEKRGRKESGETSTLIKCKVEQLCKTSVLKANRDLFNGVEEISLADYTVKQVGLFLDVLRCCSEAFLTSEQFTTVLSCAEATGQTQLIKKLEFCRRLNTFLLRETIDDEAIAGVSADLNGLEIGQTRTTPRTPYHAVCCSLSLWLTDQEAALTLIAPHKFGSCLPILTLYARGCFRMKKPERGLKHLEEAAKNFHGPALLLWGLHLLRQEKTDEALTQFNHAIARQVPLGPTACNAVGLGHYETQNYAAANVAWRRGAELGNARSQANIGMLFYYGHGVKRDRAAALTWRKLAAKSGLAVAARNVGICYYNGTGCERAYVKARKYLEMAGEDAEAQYYLGLLHRHGRGGDPDEEQAQKYFGLAAAQGHEKATKRLN